MASELIGKIDIMNPYPRHKLTPEDTKRLRKFRQSVSKKLKTKFYDLPDDWRTKKRSTTNWLFKEHGKNFDLWWVPGLFPLKDHAYNLVKLPSRFFEDWWDGDKWDWEYNCATISSWRADKFDVWWDPDKWNWERSSGILAANVGFRFDDWWDPERYDYIFLNKLAEYCSDHFDKWWLLAKITPDTYSEACGDLAEYCGEYFEIWWRKSLFNYDKYQSKMCLIENCSKYMHIWWVDEYYTAAWWKRFSVMMACEHPDKFDIWWNKKKFNYAESDMTVAKGDKKPCGRHFLIKHCHEHFDKWWDKQRIRPNAANFALIEKYCGAHKTKWAAEMIIYELGKDIESGQTKSDT